MNFGLEGRKALVTGGTHGIGKAIALALAAEGCRVAVCSRTPERVAAMAEALKQSGPEHLSIQADVTSEQDIGKLMGQIEACWGGVHILVNNVGGGGRWGSDIIEETAERVWTEVYEKNVLSSIRLTTRCLAYMRREQWGRVIAITSIFGRESGGRPWFCMAKSAQTSFMKAMAKKDYLAREGITFNSVAPGAIMIPSTGWEKVQKEDPAQLADFIRRELPLGRLGSPEEVAAVVVFLCSRQASLVNGASIPVDGGQSKSMI